MIECCTSFSHYRVSQSVMLSCARRIVSRDVCLRGILRGTRHPHYSEFLLLLDMFYLSCLKCTGMGCR